jgi:hypothetical protein
MRRSRAPLAPTVERTVKVRPFARPAQCLCALTCLPSPPPQEREEQRLVAEEARVLARVSHRRYEEEAGRGYDIVTTLRHEGQSGSACRAAPARAAQS